jgi:mannitol-1-phosphate 5-dehydrogenase
LSKKIIQYGAGNIGRSLVGQLFATAGWEVVFVDVADDIISALNREHRYRVIVKEEIESEIIVEGVRGVDGRDVESVAREIAGCDLLSTAVGPAILPRIVPSIAKGLAHRAHPLNILLCENLRGAPDIVREALRKELPATYPLAERVGLIATSIGKMVPIMPVEVRARDPLEVWAEAYNKIVADRHGFLGEIPQVKGLVVRDCFEAYVDQKLFVHNLGHAAAAYLGDHKGCITIAEAMAIPEIGKLAGDAMRESGEALLKLYPGELTRPEMEEHIEDLCRRFLNRALGDTVFRVGRDRPRKYAPNDRIIGALSAHHRAGVASPHTLEAAAAGLFFTAKDEKGERYSGDIEFERIREAKGIEGVLHEVSGLNPADLFDRTLIEAMKQLSGKYNTGR